MNNLTSCEEHFENLRDLLKVQNISTEHMAYPNNDMQIWKSLDVVGCIKILAYAIIMVGGLLGNLSVILTVALVKSVRNAVNFYVANLAVTDAMICIVCMVPHALSQYTGNRFILGAFMCKFTSFTQTTCLTSSVLTLCAISCDRFMAVFRPLEVRTTEKRTSVVIVIIWIISIGVSSPLLFVKNHVVIEWADFSEAYCAEDWPILHYRDDKTNICGTRQYLRELYHLILCTTLFFMPILIMFGAYSTILIKLWTAKIPGERSESNVQAQSRCKLKVLKMVIIVLIVFVICWTPLQIILICTAYGMHNSESSYLPTWFIELEWFAYYIAYANSFLNPLIYGQYNKDFRKGFFMIICCRRRKRRIERFWGENILTKSVRTVSTTLSTLRSTTQAFISKRISKKNEPELPETRV